MTKVCKPLVPWVGGKRLLYKHIGRLIPQHRTYVELFAGGAAVFFMKPRAHVEVLNDIDGDLMNLYRVVKHHPDELSRQFEGVLASRELFVEYRDQDSLGLTDIQRAARFYYLQKLSFGSKMVCRTFAGYLGHKPKFNKETLLVDIRAVSCRLSTAYIERLDAFDCIRKYDSVDSFFYIDPPYFGMPNPYVGSKVNESVELYKRLANAVYGMRGKALISLGYHPRVWPYFTGLSCRFIERECTLNAANPKKMVECLYWNY